MTDNEALTLQWVNNYRAVIEAPPIEALPEGVARSLTDDPIARALKMNSGYSDVSMVPKRGKFGGYAGYCRLQYGSMSLTLNLPDYVSELILDWDEGKRYGETIIPSSSGDSSSSSLGDAVEFDITDLYTKRPATSGDAQVTVHE
jgi:hypothetical protein